MAMTAATAATIAIASTAISTGAGIYSSIQSAKAQQRQLNAQASQAEYQAKIDRRNQALAEEEASAKRRAGYENMTLKRQETAKMIGRQRAAMGANGAALDAGSNLDTIAETAANGEMDAINIYNQGLDQSYRNQIEAWNYGNRAASNDANSSYYGSAATGAGQQGYVNAAIAGLSGIASMGSTWGNYKAQDAMLKGPKKQYWDRAAQTWSDVAPRH